MHLQVEALVPEAAVPGHEVPALDPLLLLVELGEEPPLGLGRVDPVPRGTDVVGLLATLRARSGDEIKVLISNPRNIGVGGEFSPQFILRLCAHVLVGCFGFSGLTDFREKSMGKKLPVSQR